MGVGYMLLYAAFVVVALWLVAELLLQHKAPLLWRSVALAGFLGVVAGMRFGSVAVIGLGAAAFAVGQTFVTLSVKRGYRAGWSLRRSDGSLPGPLARIPFLAGAVGAGAVPPSAPAVQPVGEVGPVEAVEMTMEQPAVEQPVDYGVAAEPQQQVYEMQPLQDDGAEGYGVYAGAASYGAYPQQDPYAAAAYQGGYDQAQYGAYPQQQGYYDASYGSYPPQQDPYAAAAYQGGYDQAQYPASPYDPQPDWAPQQQPWPDYSTPHPYADPPPPPYPTNTP
ncbi:hypothetical protein ACIQGZ_11450 [Streptomyces sp. NPDC092296]|uniref:hypothetical protein n=1 Tax=Streptomyces sp. NPDC092296 TaxID=3366012 RepID=UPI00380E41F3